MHDRPEVQEARIIAAAARAGLPAEYALGLTLAEIRIVLEDYARERRELDKADSWRTAAQIAAQYNCHRAKGRRPFTPNDFFSDPDAPEPSDEEKFLILAASMGAIPKRT